MSRKMKSQIPHRYCLIIYLLVTVVLYSASASADVEVTLYPAVQHQTILGWGAASWSPPWVKQSLREALIRDAVKELGLTRLRLELPSGNGADARAWEWLNDDWDPLTTNWSAFNTSAADGRIAEMIVPFKEAVEANGDPFNLYVSPSLFNGGSSGAAPVWLLNNPGEYAEFALSYLLNLKNTFGIEADFYCILNEAGNNNPFNASVVARMIKTLGPMLQAAGFSTQIEFPESISAQVAWNSYIQNVMGDEDVWPYIGCLSYHLYGTNDPYRSYIRDLGISLDLPTAQTEYMNLNMNYLYDDLVLGGVSCWEIYGLGQCFEWNPNNTSFSRIRQYWNFRQVMHYVRPGAVRIEAVSDDSNLRILAFTHDGLMTVVLINGSGSRDARIQNLPVGTYGVCQSVGGGVYQELGLQTVVSPRGQSETGALSITVPSNAVITLYSHPEGNLPPFVTDFKASPDYLNQSAPGRTVPSTTTLSVSATDPERDLLSYMWSVTSQPDDANVSLSSPNSVTTAATGLTVAGEYVFTVEISDGLNAVTRDVAFNVFADNQPPYVLDVHNRLPVRITLPSSSTQLRCAGLDLEGDPLSYRWTVTSQPAGASASLAAPTATNCQVTDMTVAGDYLFTIEVSDPTHTVVRELTVPVYPSNPSAPVISSAVALPANVILPDDTTLLSVNTSDADGDQLSHWWSVKSKPAGSSPEFSAQSLPSTNVTGLTAAGTYIFTLSVVDRTRFAKRDVTVTVLDNAGN
jgi:O-glycosyl hydrolase